MRDLPLIGSCRLGGIERKGCRFPATLYKPSLSASSSDGKPLEGQSICEGANTTGARQLIHQAREKDAAVYESRLDAECSRITSTGKVSCLFGKCLFQCHFCQ